MTTIEAPAAAGEQTRARYPDEEGYVERDGVRVFYEAYGSGDPTVPRVSRAGASPTEASDSEGMSS